MVRPIMLLAALGASSLASAHGEQPADWPALKRALDRIAFHARALASDGNGTLEHARALKAAAAQLQTLTASEAPGILRLVAELDRASDRVMERAAAGDHAAARAQADELLRLVSRLRALEPGTL